MVVIQNVSLLMTESSMATGCDVTESDATGSDVIRPKVGDSPWGVILKIYQGRQSSCPLLAKLKVLPGSLTDLSA